MQIGPPGSKRDSNFPEVVSADGSLFAVGGDERWMHPASHNHNPPYLLTRKTTEGCSISFPDSLQMVWGEFEIGS